MELTEFKQRLVHPSPMSESFVDFDGWHTHSYLSLISENIFKKMEIDKNSQGKLIKIIQNLIISSI